MGKAQVQENSWAILRYLEVLWAKYERMTAVPESPMNRKEKGQSKPPVSDTALKLMMKNREATARLEPLIRELRRHDVSHGGVSANAVLNAVRDDPAAVRRWRAAHDTNTPGADRDHWRALRAVCVLLAQALDAKHDGDKPFTLSVKTDPRDEAFDGTPAQAAATDREADRRHQHARAHRLRYARVLEMMERHADATKTACVQMVADERDVGISSVWEDVRFAEKGLWPGGRPVSPEHRWRGEEGSAA